MRKKSTGAKLSYKRNHVKTVTPAPNTSKSPAVGLGDIVIQDYRRQYGSYAAFWTKITEGEKQPECHQSCSSDEPMPQLRRINA
jgi:hypothetical protein